MWCGCGSPSGGRCLCFGKMRMDVASSPSISYWSAYSRNRVRDCMSSTSPPMSVNKTIRCFSVSGNAFKCSSSVGWPNARVVVEIAARTAKPNSFFSQCAFLWFSNERFLTYLFCCSLKHLTVSKVDYGFPLMVIVPNFNATISPVAVEIDRK